MDNIIEVQFNEMLQRTRSIWQYDYGQVLKILSGGVVLPNFLEVHFSLSRKNEKCITRIGTTVNGVTEVQIPNELLNTENKTHDYFIYAFIYVSTEKYGNTKCEIIIPVKYRIKPENPSEEPLPEPNIFHETVEAVNAAADRAKMAEQNAKESAAEAGKYAASASESAVAAEKTKEDALRKVGEKKQEAIEAIQNQEETSVGKITTHTDGEIQRIQNHAAESKGELEQTIINAGVSKEELEHSIEIAGTSKTALDKSVELAGTAKTELDTSIREAGTAKTALDEAISDSISKNIDTTLLKSGKAADAKVVGDKLSKLEEDLSNKITKFYASNQGETHITDSDNGKIQDMMIYGKSSQDGTPTPENPIEIKSVVNPTVKVTNEDGLKVQFATLNNITLNAIPVSSGGNVTIDGQQYIADYVDVERGKVVRMCGREALNTKNGEVNEEYRLSINIGVLGKEGDRECIFSAFEWSSWVTCVAGSLLYLKNIKKKNSELYTAQELKELSIDFEAVYQLKEKQEIDLTTEQTQAFKALATYYPTTNISVNSEQLEGYTVFNYPISMANGWNYVKQQLGDTRDYIYDMDAKAQDIDIQSAEAYVNSEYAVALTELEV